MNGRGSVNTKNMQNIYKVPIGRDQESEGVNLPLLGMPSPSQMVNGNLPTRLIDQGW